jgi:hypothetical protein
MSTQPFPYKAELAMPVIGLESEFKVFIDDVEVIPEDVWRTPAAFLDRPMLRRTNKSLQLPTGGALYFDGGVLEVVTPVIEIGAQCTARAVRSLWEQIGFVRDQLDAWEAREGRRVRLQAFSCHFNISFEVPREERNRDRTIQKLAVLLAHLLPVPVIITGANRRSTGFGVRPRRDRIELTFDFTPDPGLMAATTALIVGIARDVISWKSYRLDELEARHITRLAGLQPGPHASRKGWLARAEHFPRNPFKADVNAPEWQTADSRTLSLRAIALELATHFRDSIRLYADPFSYRLLFSLLRGETPVLLDLHDRPAAYDDVGRTTRWGSVLPELENFAALMNDSGAPAAEPRRRSDDLDVALAPPWSGQPLDRRASPERTTLERRTGERRARIPGPSPRLTRSCYEKVFLNLGHCRRLRIDGELLTPANVKGWYHAVFRTPEGEERMLSIDQLLAYSGAWV